MTIRTRWIYWLTAPLKDTFVLYKESSDRSNGGTNMEASTKESRSMRRELEQKPVFYHIVPSQKLTDLCAVKVPKMTILQLVSGPVRKGRARETHIDLRIAMRTVCGTFGISF